LVLNWHMHTVVVTGPSGHLGSAITGHLLSTYNVIGISRNASGVSFNSCSCSQGSGVFVPVNSDLSKSDPLELVGTIKRHADGLNSELCGLVNNAFTDYPAKALSVDTETVQACAESFLGIHVRLSLAVAEALKACDGGSIVNVASMYGKVSPKPDLYDSFDAVSPLLYCAFKSGLIQSSRYLSSILAPCGIRVNSVSYGPFPSCSVQRANPEFVKRLAAQTHLRRVAKPCEAAGIIAFLLSGQSSYVTGADIPVDGGWTAW